MPAKSKIKKVRKVREVSPVPKVSKAKDRTLASAVPSAKRAGLKKGSAAKSASKKSAIHTKKPTGLSAEVFNTAGKKEGTIALPREIFGAKVNKNLLAQAIRVYFTNASAHYGSTKTRSEVRGGGAKPWRQKGTGRARAGSRRSPLWVGGAKALGPKPRKTILTLPKKMKRRALISALSAKANASEIKIVSNFEKIAPKTKIVANFLQKTAANGSTLFIISTKNQNVNLATRNLKPVSLETAANLNTYEVIKNQNIFFSKEALGALSNRIKSQKERAATSK